MSTRKWLLVVFVLAAVGWPLYEEHLPSAAVSTLRSVFSFIGVIFLLNGYLDVEARLGALEQDFAESEAAYKTLQEQYEALVEQLDQEVAVREERHDALEQRLEQDASERQKQHEELAERISGLEEA